MTTRIQLDSFTNTIKVYKSTPTTKPNKGYMVNIENLVVPRICDKLSFDNQPLFTVYRRTREGLVAELALPIPPVANSPLSADVNVNTTFTPHNCETLGEVVWQANVFFEELCLKLISKGFIARNWNSYTGAAPNAFPADFTRQNGADWHTTVRATVRGNRAQHALQMTFREDGRVGFRFTADAIKLFVIRLTDIGKRILGWPHRYIAWQPNGSFREPYMAVQAAAEVVVAPPAGAEEPSTTVVYTDNSLYDHCEYRHEIVISTDVPLPPVVQFTQDKQSLSTQLASYRFNVQRESMSYTVGENTMGLKSTRSNVLVLEDCMPTENTFYLSHTDLQNFHINLLSRHYTYADGKYTMEEKPYALPTNAYWYLTMAITPL